MWQIISVQQNYAPGIIWKKIDSESRTDVIKNSDSVKYDFEFMVQIIQVLASLKYTHT